MKNTDYLLKFKLPIVITCAAAVVVWILLGYDKSETDAKLINQYSEKNSLSPQNSKSFVSQQIDTREFTGLVEVNYSLEYEWLIKIANEESIKFAFEQLELKVPATGKERARVWLAHRILTEDFTRLHDVMLALSIPSERRQVLGRVIPKVVAANRDTVVRLIMAELIDDERDSALRYAVVTLANALDFSSAVLIQMDMPISKERQFAIEHIAGVYSKRDIVGALKWLEKLPEKKEQDRVLSVIFRSLQQSKDTEALKVLLNHTQEKADRVKIILSVVSLTVERGDFKNAASFVNTLNNGEREVGDGAILGLDKAVSFEAAVSQAMAFQNKEARHITVSTLVRTALKRNIADTVTAIKNLPEAGFDMVLPYLVEAWGETDTKALSEWIILIPDVTRRDIALWYLIRNLQYVDAKAARQYAEHISDIQERERVLHSIPK